MEREQLDTAIREILAPCIDFASLDTAAVSAIKAASMRLLMRTSDPEAVLLGGLLTECLRVPSTTIPFMRPNVRGSQLVLEYNPNWVVYLQVLGELFLRRELRHILMHLVLSHMDIIARKKDEYQGALVNISMDICVNQYVSELHEYAAIRPICPECLQAHLVANKIPRLTALKEGDIKNLSVTPNRKACSLCRGVGHLMVDMSAVNALNSHHNGGKIRLSPGHVVTNSFGVAKTLHEELVKKAKSKTQDFSIYSLADPLVPYESIFEKSVVDSIVSHAMHQAMSDSARFSKAGSNLIDLLKEMKKERKRPYIEQLRGTLGSSMSSLTESTRYRPNRRFGYLYPGTRSKPKQRYVIALDTSGSIALDDVRKIITEFISISACSDSIECRVIFFHHEIYYDKEVGEYKEADLNNLQSGGTNFDRVFERVFSEKRKERDGCVLVMYTDGECSISFPREQVKGKIHWLLLPNSTRRYINNWDASAHIIEIEKEQKNEF